MNCSGILINKHDTKTSTTYLKVGHMNPPCWSRSEEKPSRDTMEQETEDRGRDVKGSERALFIGFGQWGSAARSIKCLWVKRERPADCAAMGRATNINGRRIRRVPMGKARSLDRSSLAQHYNSFHKWQKCIQWKFRVIRLPFTRSIHLFNNPSVNHLYLSNDCEKKKSKWVIFNILIVLTLTKCY